MAANSIPLTYFDQPLLEELKTNWTANSDFRATVHLNGHEYYELNGMFPINQSMNGEMTHPEFSSSTFEEKVNKFQVVRIYHWNGPTFVAGHYVKFELED